MIKRVSLGVILGIATLLGMWLATDQEVDVTKTEVQDNGQEPDYYMDNFTVSVMDDAGRLAYTLTSKHMDHYVKSNITIMESPYFEFFQNSSNQWLMKAEKGHMQGDDNEVLLQGEVHITREDFNNQTDIVTTNLYVYPKTKKVHTEDPVQIIDASGSVTAVGLEADFASDRVQLLSDVKSQYLPVQVQPTK